MPSEILRNKYTPDYRMLWRLYYNDIKSEYTHKKNLYRLLGAEIED